MAASIYETTGRYFGTTGHPLRMKIAKTGEAGPIPLKKNPGKAEK
jgi:hypothetical protein